MRAFWLIYVLYNKKWEIINKVKLKYEIIIYNVLICIKMSYKSSLFIEKNNNKVLKNSRFLLLLNIQLTCN